MDTTAAKIQITAEQLIQEASEQANLNFPGADERGKRAGFENAVKRNRKSIGTWLKYAEYEESQMELARARSIYERALEVDAGNVVVWLRYVEMEMRHKNTALARNLWHRTTHSLPFVETFWYKYVYFEEVLGNIQGVRDVFERWMSWKPREDVWRSYVRFEKRHREFGRARQIFERLVVVHCTSTSWIRYAEFEEELGEHRKARAVYERATEMLANDQKDSKLFLSFARFELSRGGIERARDLFRYAQEFLPTHEQKRMEQAHFSFTRQHGNRAELEKMVLAKRRRYYEEQTRERPRNYDIWFDYIQLEETHGTIQRAREVYQRAVEQLPSSLEKEAWRRYIYLWIYYALFEEIDACDMERAAAIYTKCLSVIPHRHFTFAKIWRLFAQFWIRRRQLDKARKVLGTGIGKSPKRKLFRIYLELEVSLREFDRCRKIYEKYILYNPAACKTWMGYASLEVRLGDLERARGIYQLGISQSALDHPELLWKSYIDFETGQREWGLARDIYEKLLQKTQSISVWTNYALMEEAVDLERARGVFDRGQDVLKEQGLVRERICLLTSWLEMEQRHGSEWIPKVEEQIRNVQDSQTRLLEAAYRWKQDQAG